MNTGLMRSLSKAAALREELRACNAIYAERHGLEYVPSLGPRPTLMYQPLDEKRHGDFLDATLSGDRNPRVLTLSGTHGVQC
jgi:hypothetical protein